ncbi:MAG TPA: DUF5615 family PIN-like protein [Chloroflexota bacterium]|nr:DUF5615 family PIN-like protein [Chloroflexota bacterium]
MTSVYLDECSDDDDVIRPLRNAGREVHSPRDLGNLSRADEEQLQAATELNAVLATQNYGDFCRLHDGWKAEGRHHAGILLLTPTSLAQRIAYLERAARLLTPEAARDQLMFLSLFATEWEARAYVTSLSAS